MAPRTLSSKHTSLNVPSLHIRYTCGRLKAHPLGAPHLLGFLALRDQCVLLSEKERALDNDLVDAQALVDHADAMLNAFINKATKALDLLADEDRSHALFTHYFGSETPSRFKRVVLGDKLATLNDDWLPSFTDSEHTSLKALAAELEALVALGKAAASAKTSAETALAQFRDIGARFAFFQELNGARKELYGKLAKASHEQLGLPKKFAEGFFLRLPKDTKEEPTIKSVEGTIKKLVKQLEEQQKLLDALNHEQAQQQGMTAEVAEDETTLAALKKQQAALAAQAKELQEKIKAKAKKTRRSKKQ